MFSQLSCCSHLLLKISLVVLFLCGHVASTGVIAWQYCYRGGHELDLLVDWIGLDLSCENPDWIELDWIHEFMDWTGFGQQKWTLVQLYCHRLFSE